MTHIVESKEKKMSKIKAIVIREDELQKLNERAEKMHLSTSRLLVLAGLNWDGKIHDEGNK